MSALLSVFGNACVVLFYSAFAGAGLYLGAYFAYVAFPLRVSVDRRDVTIRFGRRKGEDGCVATPQSAIRNPQSEGSAR